MNPNRNKSTRGRAKSDFYETPYEMARAVIEKLFTYGIIYKATNILDPGCGNGVWTDAFLSVLDSPIPEPHGLSYFPYFVGVDINEPERNKFLYSELIIGDYLEYSPGLKKFDLIIGNPPFSLMEEFVRKSISLVAEHGTIALMGRLAFLGSQKRAKSGGLFTEYPPHNVWVSSRRPSFFSVVDGKHTTDMMEYAIYIWRQGLLSIKTPPMISWFLWDYNK